MGKIRKKWRFSLRCMSSDVIQVCVRLKNHVNTPRGCYIIRRSERQLLNECIISINNTLKLYGHQKNTYIHHIKGVQDQTTMEGCNRHIKRVIEARHIRSQNAIYLKIGDCANKIEVDAQTLNMAAQSL